MTKDKKPVTVSAAVDVLVVDTEGQDPLILKGSLGLLSKQQVIVDFLHLIGSSLQNLCKK